MTQQNASVDRPIYRFMDLFELYELVVNSKLKFTKLRLMEDKNEGLGEIFKLQSSVWGVNLRNHQKDLKEEYDSQRENVYISCWTPLVDAMAMWLLYSKNNSNFRIKTSDSKLRAVLDTNSKDVFLRHWSLSPGNLVPMMHDFLPVRYVNFNHIHELSREKLEAYDQKLVDAYRRGATGSAEVNALLGDRSAGQIDDLKHAGHLKDEAYKHENELRASFHLRIRNKMTLEEFRDLPDSFNNVLGNPMLEISTRKNSPSVVHLTVPSDFIEEICFDSRMPQYHQATIRQVLGNDDLSYVTTAVFGCLMDDRDFTIKEI